MTARQRIENGMAHCNDEGDDRGYATVGESAPRPAQMSAKFACRCADIAPFRKRCGFTYVSVAGLAEPGLRLHRGGLHLTPRAVPGLSEARARGYRACSADLLTAKPASFTASLIVGCA